MAGHGMDLGAHRRTHGPSGGIAGFQHKRSVTKASWIIFGASFGFVPGLFIALFTDFVPALLIGTGLGAVGGHFLSRRMGAEAQVTEAQVHERGVILTDRRGTHAIAWSDVTAVLGQRIETEVGVAPFVDVKGRTTYVFVVRTRHGLGYILDDRLQDVVALADAITKGSGVAITPLR